MKDAIISLCFIIMAFAILATSESSEKVCVRDIQYESSGDRAVLKLCDGDVKIIEKRDLKFEDNEYFIRYHSLVIKAIFIFDLFVAGVFLFSYIDDIKIK